MLSELFSTSNRKAEYFTQTGEERCENSSRQLRLVGFPFAIQANNIWAPTQKTHTTEFNLVPASVFLGRWTASFLTVAKTRPKCVYGKCAFFLGRPVCMHTSDQIDLLKNGFTRADLQWNHDKKNKTFRVVPLIVPQQVVYFCFQSVPTWGERR